MTDLTPVPIETIRAASPAYKDIPDGQLAALIYKSRYADKMSEGEFYQKIGIAPPQVDQPTKVGAFGFPVGGGAPSPGMTLDPHEGSNAMAEPGIRDAMNVGGVDRFKLGLGDPPLVLGQMAGRGYEGLTGDPQFREQADRVVNQRETDYQNARAGAGQDGFDVARLFGRATATAPMMTAFPAAGGPISGTVLGATTGALGAALQEPVIGDKTQAFWMNKGEQAGTGALGGAAIGGTTGLASSLIGPRLPQSTVKLREAGMPQTVGQTIGPNAARFESAMESVPLLGDVIRNAKGANLDAFNRGLVNQTLGTIGEKLPENIATGRDALRYMGQKVTDAYSAAVPAMTATIDGTFATEVKAAAASLKSFPAVQEQFYRIMKNEVASKVDAATGTISGQNFKIADSQLGELAASFRGTPDANQRALGGALQQVNKALMNSARTYSPPEAVAALDAADKAYAMMLRLENAAGRAGTDARDGVFTPSQLSGAVKNMDPSLRGRAYSRGDAMMQDMASAGVQGLGDRLPNSGTADRSAAMAVLAGLAALAGGGQLPQSVSLGLGALPLAAIPYTRWGQAGINAAIAGGNSVRTPIGEGLRGAVPYASSGGGLLGGQMLLPLLP